MLLGDIKAAYTVIGSIRMTFADPWDRRQTEAQIQELAGSYDHPDVLWICCVVARDPNNRSPIMLQKLASKTYEKLHAKVASNPTPGPRESDKGFLCDVCTKPERDCQTDATNLDGIDHAYISARRAKLARDQMPAGGRIAAARARAAIDRDVSKISAGFKLPDDIASDQTQIQEEEAS